MEEEKVTERVVPTWRLAALAAVPALIMGVGGYILGHSEREVEVRTQKVDVVKTKTVETKVKVPTDPKATCMYRAILAYPEYVAVGGEYQANGNKQLLDVLPECKTLTTKEKVRMRAQIQNMIGSPLP